MNRKLISRIVVLSFVCLAISSSFLATEAVAQTTQHRLAAKLTAHADGGGRVQSDLPGLLAIALAQGLAAQGKEVHLDGTSLTVATEAGELILDLPATQKALERREITVSIDGLVVQRDRVSSPQLSQLLVAAGGGFDLLDCLESSLDIYDICLTICDFSDGPEVFCSYSCTVELPLNTLRCTFVD
jgi:hypothetical protein